MAYDQGCEFFAVDGDTLSITCPQCGTESSCDLVEMITCNHVALTNSLAKVNDAQCTFTVYYTIPITGSCCPDIELPVDSLHVKARARWPHNEEDIEILEIRSTHFS